jgi:PAS domain S-box-containing protein
MIQTYIASVEKRGVMMEHEDKTRQRLIRELDCKVNQIDMLETESHEDFEEIKSLKGEISRQFAILNAINRILQESLDCRNSEEVAKTCLAVAEELTGSKFGFIDELNDNGRLDSIAISDPGWDECRIPNSKAVVAIKDMEIRGIWSKVIKDGISLITNDPYSHPDSVGTPEGHPKLTSFLGVPLKRKDRTIGQIALANKEPGYDEDDLRTIESLSSAFVEALTRIKAEEARVQALTEAKAARMAIEIIESMMDPVVVTDIEGKIIRFNKAFTDMFGYGEEILGELPTKIVIEKEASEVLEILKSCIQKRSARNIEYTAVSKYGEEVPVLVNVNLMKDSTGNPKGIITVIRNITEMKRDQEKLKASEERYRSLVENVPDAIYSALPDETGTTTFMSKRWREWTGYSPEDFYDDHETWPKSIYSEDLDKAVLGYIEACREGKAYDSEYRLIHKDTKEIIWVRDHGMPIKDEEGRIVRIEGVVTNITRRKEAEIELNRKSKELERSNKELEQFAYVASHDLQEPLRKIQAFGDRLVGRYGDRLDERGLDYLERMKNAAERMQRLINDLLTYSRVTTRAQPFESVDLNQVVQTVLDSLEARIESVNGRVEIGKMNAIEADPMQMMQLLQNLISNGLKFHKEDEPPVVRVYSELSGEKCRIIVEDNGIGFEEKYLDRIFTIFQRLHGRFEYEGTGVGLAICRRIVERHRGSITAKSSPDKGARFIITLPIKQAQGGRS